MFNLQKLSEFGPNFTVAPIRCVCLLCINHIFGISIWQEKYRISKFPPDEAVCSVVHMPSVSARASLVCVDVLLEQKLKRTRHCGLWNRSRNVCASLLPSAHNQRKTSRGWQNEHREDPLSGPRFRPPSARREAKMICTASFTYNVTSKCIFWLHSPFRRRECIFMQVLIDECHSASYLPEVYILRYSSKMTNTILN